MERASQINRRPDGNALKSFKFFTALIGLIYSPLVFSQALKGNFNGDIRGMCSVAIAIVILYPCIRYLSNSQMRLAAFIIPSVIFLVGLVVS